MIQILLQNFYCEQAAGQTRSSRGSGTKKCEYGCKDGACVAEPAEKPEELKDVQTFTVYAGVEVYYKNSIFEVNGAASDPGTSLSDPLDMRWSLVSYPPGGKIKFSNAKCLAPNWGLLQYHHFRDQGWGIQNSVESHEPQKSQQL